MITIDMDKAKSIAVGRVRLAREPVLKALDVSYMRAIEANDMTAGNAIAAKKQVLRDAPADARIHEATNPDELTAAVSAIVLEMGA